jgi:hypothetical protein
MHNKAAHNLFPEFSLKKKTAIIAVATPSRLSNNETEKPDIRFNPVIWLIGAIIPPARIAPINQGRSFLSNLLASSRFAVLLVNSEYKNNPRNAPRYRRPAKVIGETALSSSLANGELSPKREADIRMYKIGFLSKCVVSTKSGYANIVLFMRNTFQLKCRIQTGHKD